MIAELLTILDTVADGRIPVPLRHGLCELHPVEGGTHPVKYTGAGGFVHVATDQGYSYWRITGPFGEAQDERFRACDGMATMSLPLRFVVSVDREICTGVEDVTRAMASDMRRAKDSIRSATGAALVEMDIRAIDVDTLRVWRTEFGGPLDQTTKALVAIELTATITGREACFDVCGEPVDVLCALVRQASNAKVVECLGAERVAEICDAPVIPCPLEWVVRDQEGNTLASGTVADPCATPELDIDVDCPGGPCDPLTLTVNEEPFDTVENPCGSTVDVPVVNTSTTPVGQKIGDDWVVGDSNITFEGIPLISLPAEVPFETGCGQRIGAVLVEGGPNPGIYVPDGDLNGKEVFSKDADFFAWNNTRWFLNVDGGPNIEAEPGNEEFPWQADWGGAGITVAQATIGSVCAEPCPPTTVNGVESETNTITVTREDEPIGTFDPVTGNVDIPPCDPCPSLCSQITAAETTEITDCIRSAGKRTAVQCDLMGTAEVENALTEFACFPEAVRDAILAAECPGSVNTLVATWAANNDETLPVPPPAFAEGVAFDFVSQSGTNGTITVSVNNGASFAAPPFTPVAGVNMIFRRTTITAVGSATFDDQ